jgi:hypothetical protein
MRRRTLTEASRLTATQWALIRLVEAQKAAVAAGDWAGALDALEEMAYIRGDLDRPDGSPPPPRVGPLGPVA